MTEKFTAEEVITACGFLPNITLIDEHLRFNSFYSNVIVRSGLGRYARLLYRNGAFESRIRDEYISKRDNGEFQVRDDAFLEWENRCLQMKEILSLSGDNLQLFYSNGNQKRTQINALSPQALSTIVDMQLKDLAQLRMRYSPRRIFSPLPQLLKMRLSIHIP